MAEPVLSIRNLKKNFGTREILKGISFDVHKGDVVTIIGPSGSGKSTLIRCVNFLETPTDGQVLYKGKPVRETFHKLPLYRTKVGMVFQQFNLFNNLNVLDNCTVGPVKVLGMDKLEAEQRAVQYLETVGMHGYVNAKPGQLSGGQKQRVGIARALASNPKVLLSDEATSALDPQTTKSILALLKDINKKLNLTIVMITHQMEVVKEICDRVAVIENGHIIEQGSMYKVFTEPQEETTKEFVRTVNDIKIPPIIDTADMKPDYFPGSCLLANLEFLSDPDAAQHPDKKSDTAEADQPVVSALVKKFGVDVNIISGKVDYLKDTPYGTLLVEIIGGEKAIQDSLAYLNEVKVKLEVLGYVK